MGGWFSGWLAWAAAGYVELEAPADALAGGCALGRLATASPSPDVSSMVH